MAGLGRLEGMAATLATNAASSVATLALCSCMALITYYCVATLAVLLRWVRFGIRTLAIGQVFRMTTTGQGIRRHKPKCEIICRCIICRCFDKGSEYPDS